MIAASTPSQQKVLGHDIFARVPVVSSFAGNGAAKRYLTRGDVRPTAGHVFMAGVTGLLGRAEAAIRPGHALPATGDTLIKRRPEPGEPV